MSPNSTAAGRRVTRRLVACVTVALGLVVLAAPPVSGHEERAAEAPRHNGTVPVYRQTGPAILVCGTDRAGFERRIAGFPPALRERNRALFATCLADGVRTVQAAVDAATPGTRVLILPGVYQEAPSLRAPAGACADLAGPLALHGDRDRILTWEQQVACPHEQNLVAVLGKRDLQIEGTGASPLDVVLDAGHRKANTLRVDRSDGVYLRNFTAQRSTFNAVYVMETDGFVLDRTVGRWSDEYGFLTFATDHGLYTGCEAYGNGEAGIYPGAAANLNAGRGFDVQRYAIEIRGCRSHHNLLGYSGTAGNSVWVHDNEFSGNTAGVWMDSLFPHHPGLPQNHATFERNAIHDNNADFYRYVRDGTCARPSARRGYERGVVCPAMGVPRGAGVVVAGGNVNAFRANWVYANEYAGFVQFWVPAPRRGGGLGELFDTSHRNRYSANRLGVSPGGEVRPNGLDVWWDGQGLDNRWQPARAEPATLPGLAGPASARLAGDPLKTLELVVCTSYERSSASTPGGCDWYGARGLARVEVLAAAVNALLLTVAAFALLRRLPRRRPLTWLATAAGLAGIGLEVAGVAVEGTRLGALGSLLLGAWWLLVGRALGRDGAARGLATTALALGGLAALQAVDRGVVTLPGVPLSLGWPILIVSLNWVGWVVAGHPRGSPRSEAA